MKKSESLLPGRLPFVFPIEVSGRPAYQGEAILSASSPTTSQAEKLPLLRWPLALFSLIALLYHTEATSSLALGPLFHQDFHLTDMQVALTTNAGVLFGALVAVPLALFADTHRQARLPFLALGMLVWGGITGLRGTAQDFYTLLLLSAPSGIGLASSAAPSSDLMCDMYPSALRSQALGILSAGQALGTLLGFLLPATLTRFLNWRLLFFLFAACALLLFLPLARLRLTQPVASPQPPPLAWWRSLREGTQHILHSRGVRVGISGYSAQAFSIGGIATFLPLFLVRYYASSPANADSLVAVVIVALLLGTVAGGFVDAALGRRFGVGSHTLVAGGATLLLGLFFGVALLLPSLLLFVLLSVASGLLLGITTAPLLALIGTVVEARHRNYAYALQMALAALGQVLGALVVGELADQVHNLQLALLLFSGVVLLVGGWIASQSRSLARSQEKISLALPLEPDVIEQQLMVVSLTPPALLVSGHRRDMQSEDWIQAIEAAAARLGENASVSFLSAQGFRIFVHPHPIQPDWILSHLVPGFGMNSIRVPSRRAGIRLALRDPHL